MKLEPLIYVSDLFKSANFYNTILGFKLGKYYPSKDNPTYVSVFLRDYKLMLCLVRESNNKFHPQGLGVSGVQFFIKVDNVDEVYQKIKDKVKIIDDIESKNWGDREFTIQDPDGYLISFYTPIT